MRIAHYLCTLVCAITTIVGGWPATLMAQGAYTDRNIAIYQHMVRRQPFDAGAYYRLGDAYMQKARETGDVMYYGLAEKALRKALDIAPHYSQALRHLAQALYSQHAFAEAAVQAAQAITLNPADSHAYGVLGDAFFEIGKYPQAEAAYRHMLQIQQDLYSYSRMAGFKSLHGDPHGAIADLERAMQTGLAQQLPQESIAWVQWQLGNEYFALGDLATAESQYQQSLETFRHSHRALAGLAYVRATQQRYEEAIALYHRALAITPLPDYIAALVLDAFAKPVGMGSKPIMPPYYQPLQHLSPGLAGSDLVAALPTAPRGH